MSMPTMSSKSCKQKGLLKRVTKNVMNMRKLFNSSEKKEDSWYDPDKVTNDTKDKKERVPNKKNYETLDICPNCR